MYCFMPLLYPLTERRLRMDDVGVRLSVARYNDAPRVLVTDAASGGLMAGYFSFVGLI